MFPLDPQDLELAERDLLLARLTYVVATAALILCAPGVLVSARDHDAFSAAALACGFAGALILRDHAIHAARRGRIRLKTLRLQFGRGRVPPPGD